jgi:hypothetical protein
LIGDEHRKYLSNADGSMFRLLNSCHGS